MRTLIIILVLLACAKIGAKDYVARQATADVIIAAYRERAVSACQSERRTKALGTQPAAWTVAATRPVRIGNAAYDVALWQVDHPHWSARYRSTYLLLMAKDPGGTLTCTYNLLAGTAGVTLS